MQLRQLLNECESNAGTLVSPSLASFDAMETVEDARQFASRGCQCPVSSTDNSNVPVNRLSAGPKRCPRT